MMVEVIAEAGVDHEGSWDRLLGLFQTAYAAKADVFKIQYYEKGFRSPTRELPWLPMEELKRIKEKCDEVDMEFLVTPHDKWAIDELEKADLCTRYKVGSADWDLIPWLMMTKKPLIISCGLATLEQRQEAAMLLKDYPRSFLYCVSKYPAEPKDIALWRLRQEIHFYAGYSDHSVGMAIPLAVVAMGARIVEKHICIQRNVDGHRDTFCALNHKQFIEFVRGVRQLEQSLRFTSGE
jgi:sialic acid synthase SpsE